MLKVRVKKIVAIIFIIGIVFLSTFCAPYSIPNYVAKDLGWETIQKGYRHVYSNIFSPIGTLEIGKFSFYILLWAIICYTVVFIVGNKNYTKNSN